MGANGGESAGGMHRPGWPFLVAVQGESMRPAIRHGDLILVTPGDGSPRPGQAVVLRTPVGLVVHRVVGLARDHDGRTYCRTAGDANRREDLFLVPEEAVLGVVRARLPRAGVVHLWAARALAALASRLHGIGPSCGG